MVEMRTINPEFDLTNWFFRRGQYKRWRKWRERRPILTDAQRRGFCAVPAKDCGVDANPGLEAANADTSNA